MIGGTDLMICPPVRRNQPLGMSIIPQVSAWKRPLSRDGQEPQRDTADQQSKARESTPKRIESRVLLCTIILSFFKKMSSKIMNLKFPKDFLWGAATAAYQVEGGNFNSDWEKYPPKKGKGPAGIACDHYNRFEQDFDLAKQLNHNAHRLSIEWARIEPKQGEFSQKEIEHYREVFKALKDRGFKIMLTLHHFTLPCWFVDLGGFEKKKNLIYFQRYAEKMLNEYGDLIDFWTPTNEPNVYSGVGYLVGLWPPGRKNPFLYFKTLSNLVRIHKSIYNIFHEQGAVVGSVKNCIYLTKPFRILGLLQNHWFLKKVKNYQDFIGLNYYFVYRKKTKITSDMGWSIYPKGIYFLLKELKKYNKPIYITENGIADADDSRRKDFIKTHLEQVHRAIKEGVDVKGYLYWSLMDNFEWADGYGPRFGLIEIDYNTMERRIRKSAEFYADVCKNNQLEIEN